MKPRQHTTNRADTCALCRSRPDQAPTLSGAWRVAQRQHLAALRRQSRKEATP